MTMAGQAGELEGWLARKSAAVDYMVAIRENLGAGSEIADMREMQGLIAEDKEFLDFYYGHEDDGKVVFFYGGDVTDKMDPRSRIWYKEAKAQGKMIVTEVYQDFNTGKFCVTMAYQGEEHLVAYATVPASGYRADCGVSIRYC